MDVEVRPAEYADIERIREVARRAWESAHEPIVGGDAVERFLTAYYDAESFRARIDREEAILDVAAASDVVGYVLASPDGEAAATFDLSQIYVAPSRWGDGVGRTLLEHLERRVRDRGGSRVRLGVMAENDRAVRFYEAAGYRRTGEFYDDRIDAHGYTYAKDL